MLRPELFQRNYKARREISDYPFKLIEAAKQNRLGIPVQVNNI